MTAPVRLVLDAARCDGHGICALRCPELVSLDPWGYAGVDGGCVSDASLLRRARRAAAACPEGALSFVTVAPAPTDDLLGAASSPASGHDARRSVAATHHRGDRRSRATG